MKKGVLTILIVLAGITALFAKQKKTVNPTKINYISMKRTACFGRCPDYQIEIYSNGIVKYFGYMFVKDTGVYQKNIGAAKAIQIFKQFETYRVDTCRKNYEQRIADLLGLYFTIQYNDSTQQINNAHFGPVFLKILADDIDKKIKVDRSWKRIAKKAER